MTLYELKNQVKKLRQRHADAATKLNEKLCQAADMVEAIGLTINRPAIFRAYFSPDYKKPIVRRESAKYLVALVPGQTGSVKIEEGETPEIFPGDFNDLRRQVEHVESALAVIEQVGDNLPLLIAGARDTWSPEEGV